MTKKQNNISHILTIRNKMLRILILLLLICLAISGFYKYRMTQLPVYSKLQGYYEMVLDSTYVYRSIAYSYFDLNLRIDGKNIRLPLFDCDTISVMRKTSYDELRKEFDKREEECNGSWKVISSNPDSIFINAKGHVLHGKYRVLFITDSIGYVAKYPVDYIILENDSTHLCMTRVEQIIHLFLLQDK